MLPPFCENYAKFYFDGNHSVKGLNSGGEIFGVLFFFFFSKKCPFWSISDAVSRLGPSFTILVIHPVMLYDHFWFLEQEYFAIKKHCTHPT